jgi:hypothetical protein
VFIWAWCVVVCAECHCQLVKPICSLIN